MKVDRIVERTTDSVLLESDGRARRIPIVEVVAVVERKRGMGMAQGAAVGGGIGAAVGIGVGIYQAAAACDETGGGEGEDYGLGAVVCVYAYAILPLAFGVVGGLAGAIPGAVIGLEVGHTQIYRRKPPLTIAPTRGGVRALWTIEF